MKIFVQIASYRDPELLPTIRDCIGKAKNPENLTFGICWQRDETETLEEFFYDKRFRIIDIHWSKSKGLCWARSEIQRLYNGEDYTLQIDSHMRFEQNWDKELIEIINMVDSDKPIISSYPGMYDPVENKLLNVEPYKIVATNFTKYGTINFVPNEIENWQNLKKPIRARFVAGGYFFTLGKHCEEYKYDPNIYFAGDEISLAIRSYTLGYDLYHPHKTLIWHEYIREGKTKHWTDFNEENKNKGIVDKQWWEIDFEGKKRLRQMLQEEDNNIDLGVYGLGTVRTHKDYENYAGINFKFKRLHPNTLKGIEPPINDLSEWFLIEEKEYTFNLDIPPAENFKFIYVGIESKNGDLLYRKDLLEYQSKLKVNLKTTEEPHKWVYWIYDLNNQWINRKDIYL